MKYKSLSFKLWFTIISSIILSVVFAYSLSQYFYKNIYVEKVKKDLINESSLLAADYSGGQITHEFNKRLTGLIAKMKVKYLCGQLTRIKCMSSI